MPTNMGPPREPCASTSSRKRKQPDEEESLLERGVLRQDPIENEYENLDDDDEEQEVTTLIRERTEFNSILKAQEPSTITQYDDIKVTAFNLKEEKEEGEFDEMGNFIFRKSSPTDDELNDTWAESVDWDAVRKRELEAKEREDARSARDEEQPKTEVEPKLVAGDRLSCYRRMLRIMRSDETVQKTIRRIGNEVPKRRPINKNKSKAQQSNQSGRGGDDDDDNDNLAKVTEARKKLDQIIELAHHLLEEGDTDIYQKSYEDLEEAIN